MGFGFKVQGLGFEVHGSTFFGSGFRASLRVEGESKAMSCLQVRGGKFRPPLSLFLSLSLSHTLSPSAALAPSASRACEPHQAGRTPALQSGQVYK